MSTTRLNHAIHTLRVVSACARKSHPEGTDKTTLKKALDELHKGLQKGLLKAGASSSPLTLLFTSLTPHTTTSVATLGQGQHAQPCRDSGGRAMEYERASSGAAWRRRQYGLFTWAKHERLTVVMALGETLHPSAQKKVEQPVVPREPKMAKRAQERAEPSPTGADDSSPQRSGQWAALLFRRWASLSRRRTRTRESHNRPPSEDPHLVFFFEPSLTLGIVHGSHH